MLKVIRSWTWIQDLTVFSKKDASSPAHFGKYLASSSIFSILLLLTCWRLRWFSCAYSELRKCSARCLFCLFIYTVSCTFSYHTWQFIIFTIFTITACIFSYSLSISFWTQDLALQQILSSIDLFLSYRMITRTLGQSNDFTLLNGCTGKCVRLSRILVGFRMHFKSLHFHFISFHLRVWTLSYCRIFGGAIAASAFLNLLLPSACKVHFVVAMLVRIMQGLIEVTEFDFSNISLVFFDNQYGFLLNQEKLNGCKRGVITWSNLLKLWSLHRQRELFPNYSIKQCENKIVFFLI